MKRRTLSFEWRQTSFEARAPSTALRAVPLPRFRGGGWSIAAPSAHQICNQVALDLRRASCDPGGAIHLYRHGRTCSGHTRLCCCRSPKMWMPTTIPGSSPGIGMTFRFTMDHRVKPGGDAYAPPCSERTHAASNLANSVSNSKRNCAPSSSGSQLVNCGTMVR